MTPMEQLLEKEAIKELRIMYSHYFDGKNLDGLVDLFTEDAVCEFGPEYGGDWVGKARIRENYARFLLRSAEFEAWEQRTRGGSRA